MEIKTGIEVTTDIEIMIDRFYNRHRNYNRQRNFYCRNNKVVLTAIRLSKHPAVEVQSPINRISRMWKLKTPTTLKDKASWGAT